jgi:hypothetical protein
MLGAGECVPILVLLIEQDHVQALQQSDRCELNVREDCGATVEPVGTGVRDRLHHSRATAWGVATVAPLPLLVPAVGESRRWRLPSDSQFLRMVPDKCSSPRPLAYSLSAA